MNQKISILLFVIVFASINSELSAQNLIDSIVPTIDLTMSGNRNNEQKFVIRNDDEYFDLRAKKNIYHIDNFNIDFTKYIMIGFDTAVGGCKQAEIEYYVKNIENKYIIDIKIVQNGSCKGISWIHIWFIVPKYI